MPRKTNNRMKYASTVIVPILSFLLYYYVYYSSTVKVKNYIDKNQENWSMNVTCSKDYESDLNRQCHVAQKACSRFVVNDFISSEQTRMLVDMAEKGMFGRNKNGGPCIMDMNSGYVKDGDGLVNMYRDRKQKFTKVEYDLYKSVIERIRLELIQRFGIGQLYFTAPTFITRIVGNATWSPKDMHDEYWHAHVDKSNTAHYDYSGLVYLSDYNTDFKGGLFGFIDGKRKIKVEPKKGRLLMFTAGSENLHRAYKVRSGKRYVMSMWFTCNKQRHFPNFLDGKVHAHYQQPMDDP